jgi:hypothetical protein
MTFDNSKGIIGLRIRLFTITVIVLGYLILAYGAEMIKFPLLGLSETFWTLFLIVLWLIIALMPMILNYQYVFFSDETERIVIRYYYTGIVGGKKNSVEIDKISFGGYSVKSELMGLKSSITFYQKFSEGVAKYPPVYISALTKQEKGRLFTALKKYSNPVASS